MDTAVCGRNRGIREIDLDVALAMSPDMRKEETQEVLSLVTTLDLSRNEIEALEHLEPLRNMRRLDVSYNMISRINGLPLSLTHINLSHNKLRSLDGLMQLPHLRELDISNNRLSDFTFLNERVPLRLLRADDNRLVSTMGLERAVGLRVLSLSNNFIEHTRDLAFLSSAVELRALCLRNNPITRLRGYRQLVAQRHQNLITLDGAPLLRGSAPYGVLAGGSYLASEGGDAIRAPATATKEVSGTSTTLQDVRSSRPPMVPISVNRSYTSESSFLNHPSRPLTTQEAFQPLVVDQSWQAEISADGPSPSSPQTTRNTTRARNDELNPPSPIREVANPEEALVTTPAQPTRQSNSNAETPSPLNESLGPAPQRSAPTPHPVSDSFSKGSYAQQFRQATAAGSSTRGASTSHTTCGPSMLQLRKMSREPRKTAAAAAAAAERSLVSTSAPDVVESRQLTVALHDALAAQEQLQRENRLLRSKLARTEEQHAEGRRTISTQLAELSSARLERDALRHANSELTERLNRMKRSARATEGYCKDEVKTVQDHLERVKTFYEAQLADLRRQLAAERVRRNGVTQQQTPLAPSAATTPPCPALKKIPTGATRASDLPCEATSALASVPQQVPEPSIQSLSLDRPDNEVGADALASQLKAWLYSEIAGDACRTEEVTTIGLPHASAEAEDSGRLQPRAQLEALILKQQIRQEGTTDGPTAT